MFSCHKPYSLSSKYMEKKKIYFELRKNKMYADIDGDKFYNF